VLAERLVAKYQAGPSRTDHADAFRRRWHLVVAMFLHRQGLFSLAKTFSAYSLKLFPDDVPLLLEAGALYELLGDSAASVTDEPERVQRRRDDSLAAARRHLQRALTLDPRSTEARLRLARIGMLGGNLEDAGTLLSQIAETLERSSDVPRDAGYVSDLFQGHLAEQRGDLSGATIHFRRAIDRDPATQSARLALARVSFRLGQADAAREAVRQALAVRFTGGRADPWVQYQVSVLMPFDELLADVRTEARR
jgi:tetratricopeptide (TPR) repeat protein